ncbi:hypothetical protein [Nocardia sp. BMG51109]|nr:hypothetical protein [Nocardia sp. BMG51109]
MSGTEPDSGRDVGRTGRDGGWMPRSRVQLALVALLVLVIVAWLLTR